MRTDRVSFTRTRTGDNETFRCRETGVCYQLERIGSEYIVSNSGREIIRLPGQRDLCLLAIEQQAALDFATAQADTGAYTS